MTTKSDDELMIDTGHECMLQKMLHSYKVDGRRTAIEDAMAYCQEQNLVNNVSICDELKKLVDEVQGLYPLRERRGEVKARQGRTSTPDVHVDRFVRVEEKRKQGLSLNKAIQAVAQQHPVTAPETVRRSHDLVDKATGKIEGDSYQRPFDLKTDE